MFQIIIKIVLTLVLLYLIILIWTNEIDVKKTVMFHLSSIIKFNKAHKININIDNTSFARCSLPGNINNGNFGLVLYGFKIINSSEENLTMKEVIVRYTLNGKVFSVESSALLTGTLYDPQKKKNINAIIVKHGADRVIHMGWNNITSEIGDNRVLPPGGVLSGSALFVLGFRSIEELSKIKEFKIVIVDYSGNETVHDLAVESRWIDQAKYNWIENRSFEIDPAGNIRYSN